ncbi:MAG: cysteine desulfurase [Desulfurococcales archaeon]|nr:cysteine desulfurase [Desulfurococcales archaeon]
MFTPYEIRKDFPILRREINGHPLIYFDNNATTLKPIQVINAVKKVYEEYYSNIHRGVHTLSIEATEMFEEALRKIAQFINASIEELIPVYNASHGLNLAALLLTINYLNEGDEVLVSVVEHHSNMLPWRVLSKIKKYKIKYVYPDEEGFITSETVENMITSKTKVLTLTHVSNVTGAINDARKIIRVAKRNGLITVLDIAQSIPHMPIDIKDLEADFAAFSGHKMLGPAGTGGLYIKREFARDMEPVLSGGDTIIDVTLDDIKWADPPWRFHPGTPNIEGFIGLGAAVDYLKRLGLENVRIHEEALMKHTLDKVEEEGLNKYIEIMGTKDLKRRTGTFTFRSSKYSPNVIGAYLDMHGIAVRTGKHCAHPLHYYYGWNEGSVRASYYIYNTKEEIDKMINVLKKLFVSK